MQEGWGGVRRYEGGAWEQGRGARGGGKERVSCLHPCPPLQPQASSPLPRNVPVACCLFLSCLSLSIYCEAAGTQQRQTAGVRALTEHTVGWERQTCPQEQRGRGWDGRHGQRGWAQMVRCAGVWTPSLSLFLSALLSPVPPPSCHCPSPSSPGFLGGMS